MCCLRRDAGTTVVACRAIDALRSRVSMWATGSVIIGRAFLAPYGFLPQSAGTGGARHCRHCCRRAGVPQVPQVPRVPGGPDSPGLRRPRALLASPAGLGDSGQLAAQRQLAEADAAQRELAHIRPCPAAAAAAVTELHLELWRALPLFELGLFGHCVLSSPGLYLAPPSGAPCRPARGGARGARPRLDGAPRRCGTASPLAGASG